MNIDVNSTLLLLMVDVDVVELVVVGCKLNDSSTEDVIEYKSFKYDVWFIETEWILIESKFLRIIFHSKCYFIEKNKTNRHQINI